MNPRSVKIREEWQSFLAPVFKDSRFDTIVDNVKACIDKGCVIYPKGDLIFSAFNLVPPSDIKIVILGQDPYHNPGEAMGLSFSVPHGVKIPPSLRNIFKAIAADDTTFSVPPHGDLSNWARQGVFLLNAFLTVEKGKPLSHKDYGWHWFTEEVIKRLSQRYDNIVFMLWGNFAKQKIHAIDTNKHLVLQATHPSPLAGTSFIHCRHFSMANDYLIRHGKLPVEWQL